MRLFLRSAGGLKTPFKAGQEKTCVCSVFIFFICGHLRVSASSACYHSYFYPCQSTFSVFIRVLFRAGPGGIVRSGLGVIDQGLVGVGRWLVAFERGLGASCQGLVGIGRGLGKARRASGGSRRWLGRIPPGLGRVGRRVGMTDPGSGGVGGGLGMTDRGLVAFGRGLGIVRRPVGKARRVSGGSDRRFGRSQRPVGAFRAAHSYRDMC